jgi:hypothetical protein
MEADAFEPCSVGPDAFLPDTKEVSCSSSPRTEPRREKTVDVRQVRREFARLTQLFETFPHEWQTCVHDYVQVYKEALSGSGVAKAETKKCAWEFQGALLQQLEGADLKAPTPSRGADMGVWVSRVFASVQMGKLPRSRGLESLGPGSARDAARAFVHDQMLSWACTGAVWTKRWSAEPLPSEENLKAPVRDPCAICLETVKSPMRLACGHEFCARCVCKTVMAAFQAGRGPGCPFRCAEWMSAAEVEAVRTPDFAAELDADDTSAFETSSDEDEGTPRFSASNEHELPSGSEELQSVVSSVSDDVEGVFDDMEFVQDVHVHPPLPDIDGGFEDLRQNLLVTRTLLQRQGSETSDVNVGRLQHHLAALEILLGANE